MLNICSSKYIWININIEEHSHGSQININFVSVNTYKTFKKIGSSTWNMNKIFHSKSELNYFISWVIIIMNESYILILGVHTSVNILLCTDIVARKHSAIQLIITFSTSSTMCKVYKLNLCTYVWYCKFDYLFVTILFSLLQYVSRMFNATQCYFRFTYNERWTNLNFPSFWLETFNIVFIHLHTDGRMCHMWTTNWSKLQIQILFIQNFYNKITNLKSDICDFVDVDEIELFVPIIKLNKSQHAFVDSFNRLWAQYFITSQIQTDIPPKVNEFFFIIFWLIRRDVYETARQANKSILLFCKLPYSLYETTHTHSLCFL